MILVFFSGLRYFPNQQDFKEYSSVFTQISDGTFDFNHIFEPGYILFIQSVSIFTNNYSIFFIILAAISIGLNFIAIKRYMPKYIFLAILFYFVHTYIMREMGAVRTGLAASICFCWGLKYIEKGQIIRFITTVLIAMLFHLSAVIFLLVYPIYKMDIKRTNMFRCILICAIIGTFIPFGKLLSSLSFISNISRVAGYAQDINQALGVWSNPTTLKQLFFSIIGLFFYKKIKFYMPNYRIIITPYVMSVCWLMLWNDFPIIAGRLATYFSITEIILISSFIYIFKAMSKPIVLATLIVLAFAILYLNGITFLTPETGYYPYKTIFSQ